MAVVNNGFLISWNIVTGVPAEPGEFEYNYSISGRTRRSHWRCLTSNLKDAGYLQVSPNFRVIEPTETTPAGSTVGDP